jgi:hypothetical protein
MDPYDDPQWTPILEAQGVGVRDADAPRRAMGHARRCAERMNLAESTPRPELASTGYCLANPGTEYLVYLPDGGEVKVDLSGASGRLSVEWMHPITGKITSGADLRGGDWRKKHFVDVTLIDDPRPTDRNSETAPMPSNSTRERRMGRASLMLIALAACRTRRERRANRGVKLRLLPAASKNAAVAKSLRHRPPSRAGFTRSPSGWLPRRRLRLSRPGTTGLRSRRGRSPKDSYTASCTRIGPRRTSPALVEGRSDNIWWPARREYRCGRCQHAEWAPPPSSVGQPGRDSTCGSRARSCSWNRSGPRDISRLRIREGPTRDSAVL